MTFNDLLDREKIDQRQVIVLRHRPHEPELNRVLPWLAGDKPELFNAFQQTQSPGLEKAMTGADYVASFIRYQPGQALFVGLYRIGASRPLTREKYWQIPAYQELKRFGMNGFTEQHGRNEILWFDLDLLDFYAAWKGKLVVAWPPPERSWWRRAERNEFTVVSVREDSALDSAMPEWNEIVLTWDELAVLPASWCSALSQWRGVYYIFDSRDGLAYVGSAYGRSNLLGRWQQYAASGHGGNRLLKARDPRTFRFSILQRVSPDLPAEDVIRLEATWKDRLHSRTPTGLNDN